MYFVQYYTSFAGRPIVPAKDQQPDIYISDAHGLSRCHEVALQNCGNYDGYQVLQFDPNTINPIEPYQIPRTMAPVTRLITIDKGNNNV